LRNTSSETLSAVAKRVIFVLYSEFPSVTGGRETWLWNMIVRLFSEYQITIISLRTRRSTDSLYQLPNEVKLVKIPSLTSIPILGEIGRRSYGRILNAWLFSVNLFFYLSIPRPKKNEVYIALGSLFEALPLRWLNLTKSGFRYICSVRGKAAEEISHGYPLLRDFFVHTELRNLKCADMIWANGHDTAEYLMSKGHSSLIMKNGVDVSAFSKPRYHYKRPLFMKEDYLYVTMIATLRDLRGLDTAIKAATYLKKEIADFRLIFVGKGGQDHWKKLTKDLGVSDMIVFAGERSDIPDIIHFSSIILTLCKEQYGGGLSMSLLEAMAGGKPIIAWDNSIYNQILVHRENALLVPEGDPKALAEAIERLLTDRVLAKNIAEATREDVEAFDWSEVVKDFNIYVEEFVDQKADGG